MAGEEFQETDNDTTEDVSTYAIHVGWSEEDQEFVATCEEFPTLSWLAETKTEAMDGMKQVLTDVISDMKANNEPVPRPRI